jgi:hypothetical protein
VQRDIKKNMIMMKTAESGVVEPGKNIRRSHGMDVSRYIPVLYIPLLQYRTRFTAQYIIIDESEVYQGVALNNRYRYVPGTVNVPAVLKMSFSFNFFLSGDRT